MLVEFGGNVYARDNRGKKPSDYSWSNSPTAKCFEYYESKLIQLGVTVCVTGHKTLQIMGYIKILHGEQ